MSTENQNIRLRLPKARVAFSSVFEKQISKKAEGATLEKDGAYSATFLFSDRAELKELEDAVAKMMKAEGVKRLKYPMVVVGNDGNAEGRVYKGFEDMFAVGTRTKIAPKILDGRRQPITDKTLFYSGCYAIPVVELYLWKNQGSWGITATLVAAQKVSDGERFSGGPSYSEEDAANDFEVIEDMLDDDCDDLLA